MKKLLLSMLVVLLAFTALNASAALTSFSITSTTYPTGQTGANPDNTVTFGFTITNTDTAAVVASITSTAPTNGQVSITAPTIASVNIPASGTATGTFSIVVPSTASGPYTGILTAQTNSTNNATLSYNFPVNSFTRWEVSGSVLDFSGTEGSNPRLDDSNQKITIKNTGSSPITPTTSSEVRVNDTAGKQVVINLGTTGQIQPGSQKDLGYTFNRIPEGITLGDYQWAGTIVQGSESKPFTVNIRVNPLICEKGPQGNALTIEVKDPDRGDDFKPGDVMNIKISVKNTANNDKDVIVEAFLWNIDENSEIASAESDSINIDKNKKEDFDMTLTIPTSESDLGADDTLILYVEAYEDGEEEKVCSEKSVQVDGKRESRDSRITRFSVNPAITSCNQQVSMQVDVENSGKREDKGVNVNLRNNELGLDLTSDNFDLEEFDESDNRATKVFLFTVPENAQEKEYILEAVSNFDGGKQQDSEFAKLTVKGCTATSESPESETGETSLELVQTSISSKEPGVIRVPYRVTNAEAETKTYTIEVQPQGAWAEKSTSNVVLKSGEEKTDFVFVVTDNNLKEGSYLGNLVLKAGALTLGSEQFTVNIGQATAPSGAGTGATGNVVYQPSATSDSFYRNWVDSGRIFWILGMIVILVLIVFFLRLIFKSA